MKLLPILSKALVLSLPIATAVGLGAAGDAQAQVVYVAPPAPPAAYIAVNPPIFYEGRPVYWYGSNWYYRDGRGNWNYYRHEPAYLHDHRTHAPVRRPYHYRH